jgi:hypothetical protein
LSYNVFSIIYIIREDIINFKANNLFACDY